MDKIIVSGGFDPLHSEHLKMLEDASKFGEVIVLLNTDQWLVSKKGFRLLNMDERAEILKSIKYVSYVFPVIDIGVTVCETIRAMKERFGDEVKYFGNGGDRKTNNTPEMTLCEELGIECVWDLGNTANKVHSSLIFDQAFAAKLKRMGYYIYNGKIRLMRNGKQVSE